MPQESLLHSPLANRRQPLLPNPGGEAHESAAPPKKAMAGAKATRGGRAHVAEAAGRTAADCTALCCCCPCTVVNLLALTVYRVPAGLCRRVRRRRQRSVAARRKRKGGLLPQGPSSFAAGATATVEDDGANAGGGGGGGGGDAEAGDDLEKEMWDRFHGAGFWRSPSMRDT